MAAGDDGEQWRLRQKAQMAYTRTTVYIKSKLYVFSREADFFRS